MAYVLYSSLLLSCLLRLPPHSPPQSLSDGLLQLSSPQTSSRPLSHFLLSPRLSSATLSCRRNMSYSLVARPYCSLNIFDLSNVTVLVLIQVPIIDCY